MTRVKDICYSTIFFGYFISWSLTLLVVMDLLDIPPLLAYAGAIFGILGGIIMFFAGLKKFREARRRGLQVNWYNSPSLLIGSALFVLGLLPLSLVIRRTTISPDGVFLAQLILWGTVFFFVVFFLLLALIYRHKEE